MIVDFFILLVGEHKKIGYKNKTRKIINIISNAYFEMRKSLIL
jgi:hypothetical protein